MNRIITPTRKVNGEVIVPGEKIQAEIAILMASLADGVSRINNVPPTSIAVVNLLRLLGVKIDQSDSSFVVHGKGLTSFKKVNEIC